jgi:hypothetical protein
VSDDRLQQLIRDGRHAESLQPLVAQLERAGIDRFVLAVELLRGTGTSSDRIGGGLTELARRAWAMLTHIRAETRPGMLCGAASVSAEAGGEDAPHGIGLSSAGPALATCLLCLQRFSRCERCGGDMTEPCRRCSPNMRSRCMDPFGTGGHCQRPSGHPGLHSTSAVIGRGIRWNAQGVEVPADRLCAMGSCEALRADSGEFCLTHSGRRYAVCGARVPHDDGSGGWTACPRPAGSRECWDHACGFVLDNGEHCGAVTPPGRGLCEEHRSVACGVRIPHDGGMMTCTRPPRALGSSACPQHACQYTVHNDRSVICGAPVRRHGTHTCEAHRPDGEELGQRWRCGAYGCTRPRANAREEYCTEHRRPRRGGRGS